jgi:hypothetical protein
MANVGVPARFDIGRVISRIFDVVRHNFVPFFLLAAIASVPTLIFTYFTTQGGLLSAKASQFAWLTPPLVPYLIVGGIVGFLLFIVLTYMLQAALVYGTITYLNGRRASFADCLAVGLRNALPLTAIALLSLLGLFVGFLLLVVPGIILSLAWIVVAPVRIAERTPILATFGRSAALTRGSRGRIFGVVVIYVLAAGVLDAIIRPMTGFSFVPTDPFHAPLAYLVVSGILRIVLALITATGVASIYYELRLVKEGVGPEQLAAVFS